MLLALLDGENSDPMVWADAAYQGKAVETLLQDAGYESRIQEKGSVITPSLMQQKRRQLWIRTPGLGGNISVETPLLEISSPP